MSASSHRCGSIFASFLLLMSICCAQDRDGCGSGKPVPSNRVDTTERVRSLRALMAQDGLDALIIPSDDDHQNEYVGDYDKRREYISGFSGSAGTAVITTDKQALWTDGRYFDQGEQELDCNWILMKSGSAGVPTLTEWIKKVLPPGGKVGSSAKLTSTASWKSYQKVFAPANITLMPANDSVGEVWNADTLNPRPPPANKPVEVLEDKFAGRTWVDKISDVRKKLEQSSVDAVVVTALDEIAWLFNLRGTDIAYNPLFFAFATVEKNPSSIPTLYLRSHDTRLSAIASHLGCNADGTCSKSPCAAVKPYEDIDKYITDVVNPSKMSVWISLASNYHIYSQVTEELKIISDPSPLLIMKAVKNRVEREGMKNSHIRDSAVVVEFISNLEKELNEGKYWDELKVASTIDNLRRNQQHNRGLSFNTIAGSGKNAAIIHYGPSNLTNAPVDKEHILLLDSGGQYLDGTTDITRTFHFGNPKDFEKLAYTVVLLGVIDLAKVKFPTNQTLGSSLDTMARHSMWKYGLDFNHGTGHGIGMYLNVHEGPARIAPRRQSSSVSYEQPIYDGMFFSDEPGYYDLSKGFGIRLETIVMATYAETEYGSDKTYLTFEPVVYVPFEKNLILLEKLNKEQRQWLNYYHQKCRTTTGTLLKDTNRLEAYQWLLQRTEPVPLTDDNPVNSSQCQMLPNLLNITCLMGTLLISMLAIKW